MSDVTEQIRVARGAREWIDSAVCSNASYTLCQARLQVEKLTLANRRKDEFLAIIAHEMRNPLGVVRNAIQVGRLAKYAPVAIELAWQMLERQVQQMTLLVDDLLDISRISHGKLDLRRESVELATIVTRAVEMSKPLIEAFGHQVSVELPQDQLWLEAGPARLAQPRFTWSSV